jgi:2-dehydro-3-deoxygluconokinase
MWRDRRVVIGLGEPLIELQPRPEGELGVAFGGDVANLLVCLVRLLENPSYEVRLVTALGDSGYSDWLRHRLTAEGLQLAEGFRAGEPGIYGIPPDPARRPASSYWRGDSAARRFFGSITVQSLEDVVGQTDILVISGITLALCSRESFEELCSWLEHHPERLVVFDSNYRPALWPSPDEARLRNGRLEGLASVVMTSMEDETQLWGASTVKHAFERLANFPQEVVIRAGKDGCYVGPAEDWKHIPAETTTGVSTVGAGDSHAAAYIAGRLSGLSAVDSAAYGNRVAAVIVQQFGAVAGRSVRLPKLVRPTTIPQGL